MTDHELLAEAIRGFLLEKHLPFSELDSWADELVAIVAEHAGVVPAEPATHDTPTALDMVTELHEAVYGTSWARPESPQHVWVMLLGTVRGLAAGRCGECERRAAAVVPAEPASPLTRHANELPERLEAAIGTGWVDRDEDPPDFDALLADAAATIRSLASLVVPAEPATHDDAYADVQQAIDAFDEHRQRIMLLRLAKQFNNGNEHFDHSPQGASWLCLACERAAVAADSGETPAT